MCVCVGFVICGCVYVWVLFCLGCFDNCVVILVLCVLVFTGFCIIRLCIFILFFCLY